MWYVVTWYLIGFITLMAWSKIIHGEITLGEILLSIIFSALGPVWIIPFLIELQEETNWFDKKIF